MTGTKLWHRSTALSTSKTAIAEKDKGAQTAMGAEKRSSMGPAGLGTVVLAADDVARMLPHRYPVAAIDSVVEYSAGVSAVALKTINPSEPHLVGHFPGYPIYPGVMMVEALAQLAGIACCEGGEGKTEGGGGDLGGEQLFRPGSIVFLAALDGVKWKRPVRPGDCVWMEVDVVQKPRHGIAKVRARAFVKGELAVDVKSMTICEKKGEG